MKEFRRRIVNVKTFCLEKVVAALALVEMLNGSEAKKANIFTAFVIS